MHVYCPEHTDIYWVPQNDPVLCPERGRHYLGRLPSILRCEESASVTDFWEYCCNCQTFWPSNIDGKASEKCPVCPGAGSVRYWCDKCYTISFDSPTPARRQIFTISHKGIPQPGCPGCSRTVLSSHLYEHECKIFLARFTSAFAACPCCDKPIGPPPSFPVFAAEFLSKISEKDKLFVAFDILEIENNLLVESPDGELVVIPNGFGKTRAILLPKRTSFTDPQDYELYSSLFDCEKPIAGEVRILSPTVVDETAGGWLLRERGRIEVVATEPEKPGAGSLPLFSETLPAGIAASTVDPELVPSVTPEQTATPLLRHAAPTLKIGACCPTCKKLVEEDAAFCPYCGANMSEDLAPLLLAHVQIPPPENIEQRVNYRPAGYDTASHYPAVVSEVEGGRQPFAMGALEVQDHLEKERRTPPDPEQNRAPQGIKFEPVTASDFSPSITKQRLIFMGVIGTLFLAILIFWLLHKSTFEPLANGNTNQNEPTGNNNLPTAPSGMVYVPNGTFQMGRDDRTELERPVHSVSISKAFFIDLREVTCQEYESFLTANPKSPAPIGWKDRKCPAGKEQWPVSAVDWYGAEAYATWKGKRLPTEEEWEYAARGGDKNLFYPWGNSWKENAANAGSTSPGHIVAVGSYPDGASVVSGALDMVGNVWEWTSSDIKSYGGSLPQRLSNGEKVSPGKVIRGGAWNGDKSITTTTYRMGYPSRGASDYSNTGFRCVMDIPS